MFRNYQSVNRTFFYRAWYSVTFLILYVIEFWIFLQILLYDKYLKYPTIKKIVSTYGLSFIFDYLIILFFFPQYSDSSGLSMQKRLPAPNISLEGNIYPITSMIYLEDHQARLSLLVDHATGASSQKQVRNNFFFNV